MYADNVENARWRYRHGTRSDHHKSRVRGVGSDHHCKGHRQNECRNRYKEK